MNAAIKSNFGLSVLGDLSALLDEPTNGVPLELPIDLIDEDPNQPRKYFDPVTLNEMAETIKARKVRTPISVRYHPEISGRYMINHGSRRFKASIIAGKESIPSYIDNDYTDVDQAIENIQRDGFTAREIAEFIGRELAKGQKKGEIAKAIGKSNAFVTQYVALLDLPDPIAEVFNNGRCGDVTVINELVTAYKKNQEGVINFLDDDGQEISRGSVKNLREYLENKQEDVINRGIEDYNDSTDTNTTHSIDNNSTDNNTNIKEKESPNANTQKNETKQNDPDKFKKAIILVNYDGRSARLMLSKRPSRDGSAWIKFEDDGEEIDIELKQVQLISVIEG